MKLHVFHPISMGLSMLPAIERACRFRWNDFAWNSSHSIYLLVNNEMMASTMTLLMTKKNRQKTIEQKKIKNDPNKNMLRSDRSGVLDWHRGQ